MVSGGNTIYDYILPEERNDLYGSLTNPSDEKYRGQVSMVLNFRVGGLEMDEENQKYQLVKLIGYFKRWISPSDCKNISLTSIVILLNFTAVTKTLVNFFSQVIQSQTWTKVKGKCQSQVIQLVIQQMVVF